MQDSLFVTNVSRPLADRMRPEKLDDVVGQNHLLGIDAPLRRMVDTGNISSFILWGPQGCGKTTLAKILANNGKLHFTALSAVFSGVADLRKAFAEAEQRRQYGQGTLLFVDEIHRFNRAQQDGFLPYVENGTVTLVGATTENPSFELNSALLSRCKVFVLKPLSADALEQLAARAEKIMGKALPLTPGAKEKLSGLADGDGRYFINLMETIYQLARPGETLDVEAMLNVVQQRSPIYNTDREG
ncbi:MAG: AAA family ATPase, partial [Lentisphaeria bacterium]|nr:AAA family ATPase [Lentisphaeria bacterium]